MTSWHDIRVAGGAIVKTRALVTHNLARLSEKKRGAKGLVCCVFLWSFVVRFRFGIGLVCFRSLLVLDWYVEFFRCMLRRFCFECVGFAWYVVFLFVVCFGVYVVCLRFFFFFFRNRY